jgi:peptide/nickel transport system permease protein
MVIEQVYGLSDIGALAVRAVANLDRPIIIGVVLLGGPFIVAADIAYLLLDPRVR